MNFKSPSTDFNRVRDGRNAPDAYFDIDLSIAGDQFFNIAGNSFYVDSNTFDGTATVYFQETDNLRGPTPFTVTPGFIARIPFTQIRVVWASQPGKKIRLIYGVDTDFQPGSVSQVSFAGNVTIQDVIGNTNQHYFRGAIAALGFAAVPIVTAAANTNGIMITGMFCNVQAVASGVLRHGFVCAPTAPANFTSRANQIILAYTRSVNSALNFFGTNNNSRVIPPGWGIFDVDESTIAGGAIDVALEYRIL